MKSIKNPLSFLAHRLEYVQLLSLGVHIGHSLKNSVLYASWFIFGFRRDVTVINLFKFITMFRLGLSCFNGPIFLSRAIWFACQEKSFDRYIRTLAHRCGEFSSTLYWIRGMLSNYNVITRTFRRLSAMSRLVRSRKQKRYDLNFSTWHLTKFSWPGAVFVSSVQKSYFIINEALSARVPCLGITDTNAYAQACSVAVPGNDDSIDCIIFYNEIAGAYILYRKFTSVFLWFLNVRRGSRLMNFSEWLLSKYDFSKDSISLFFNFHYYPSFSLNLNHTALQFFFYKDSWGSGDFEYLRLVGGSSAIASQLLASFKQGCSKYVYFLAYHFFYLIFKKNFPIYRRRFGPQLARVLLRIKRFPLFMLEDRAFAKQLQFRDFAPYFLKRERKILLPFFKIFLRLLVTAKFALKNAHPSQRVVKRISFFKKKEYLTLCYRYRRRKRAYRIPILFDKLPPKQVLFNFNKVWRRRLRADHYITPKDLGISFAPIVNTLKSRRFLKSQRYYWLCLRHLKAFRRFRKLILYYSKRRWHKRQRWWRRQQALKASRTRFVDVHNTSKAKFGKRMFFRNTNLADKLATFAELSRRFRHRIYLFLILGLWRPYRSIYHRPLSRTAFAAAWWRQTPISRPSTYRKHTSPRRRRRGRRRRPFFRLASSRAFDRMNLLWQSQSSRFPISFLSVQEPMLGADHFWYKLCRIYTFNNRESFFFKAFFDAYNQEQAWFFSYFAPSYLSSDTWYLNSNFIV